MEEQVTYEEGLQLAKEMKAIYQRTSAKQKYGIDQLFTDIGKKILDPDYQIESNLTNDEKRIRGEKLLKEQIMKEAASKKRCC